MAIVTSDFVTNLNTCYTKVLATKHLLQSDLIKTISDMLPMIGNDPIFGEALNLMKHNLLIRSSSLNPISAFVETGLYELEIVEERLKDLQAERNDQHAVLIAASLREADAALRPSADSIRIGHMESRALAPWIRTFEAGIVQENLRRLISAYRFITGDYDHDIVEESLFCQLAENTIGSINAYFSDLIDIDRDSIHKAINATGSTLVVGTRPCGNGTVSLFFEPGKPQPQSVIGRLFIDSPALYMLRDCGWEKVSYHDVEQIGRNRLPLAA